MSALSHISTDELCKDLADSVYDIALGLKSQEWGVTEYSGGTLADRVGCNAFFVKRIVGELLKRGYMPRPSE